MKVPKSFKKAYPVGNSIEVAHPHPKEDDTDVQTASIIGHWSGDDNYGIVVQFPDDYKCQVSADYL